MKNRTILIIFTMLLSMHLQSQEKLLNVDTIINLQDVTVYGQKGVSVLESNNKKNNIHVAGKGKSSLLSIVNVDKNVKYKIRSLEFYFNYKWTGLQKEGFYIRPLIYTSKDEKPELDILKSSTLYYVTKNINDIIHINLTDFNIEIQNTDSFFIGLEYADSDVGSKFEDFNITMVPLKKTKNVSISYIKGACQKCSFSPMDLGNKNGLSLKYKIFYQK